MDAGRPPWGVSGEWDNMHFALSESSGEDMVENGAVYEPYPYAVDYSSSAYPRISFSKSIEVVGSNEEIAVINPLIGIVGLFIVGALFFFFVSKRKRT